MPFDEMAPIKTGIAAGARRGLARFPKPDNFVPTGAQTSPFGAVCRWLLVMGSTTEISDAPGNRFPPGSMAFFHTSQCVCNFMEYDLLEIVIIRACREVFGDRNALGPVVTLPKTRGGSIPLKPPLRCQTVVHQERVCERFAVGEIGHATRVVTAAMTVACFPQE